MGIINRISEYRNQLIRFFSRDYSDLIGKSKKTKIPDLKEAQVGFVLLQVPETDVSLLARKIGRVIKVGESTSGSPDYVFSGMVFFTYSHIAVSRDLLQVVEAFQKKLDFPLKLLFGTEKLSRGIYGCETRLQAGALLPQLPELLADLLQVEPGKPREWNPAQAQTPAMAPAEKSAAKPASGESTEKYILWDTLGDGRLLGIYDSRELPDKLVLINPWYYKVFACKPNTFKATHLDWLKPEQRKQVLELTKVEP